MNHLLRELAPISESVWQVLDEEARERLKPALAARKLVDFSGPLAGSTRPRTWGAPIRRSRRPRKECPGFAAGYCPCSK